MTTPKPALPEPDLLVECAQGFVRGWTELKVRAAIAAAVADARAEIANLKTVMIAAAEEIAAHWDAHCDAEGYGPQNLMRRLEEGIPSEYGYTAGAFAELLAERDALAEALAVYADPGFYHGCAFMFDRPTGGFDEDFGPNEDYDYDKPGKHARETFATLAARAGGGK
jgi:hypothetical protein